MPFLSQSRFPRLWLFMQNTIGGNAAKQALAIENYRGQRRVLEIGCSVGNISTVFSAFPDIEFTGVDIDPEAIKLAKQRHRHLPNFNFSLCSLEELSRRGEQFDYVLFAGMLHHVDDTTGLRLLKEALRCTAVDGHLVIYEPEAVRPGDHWFFRFFYAALEQGQFLRTRCDLAKLVEAAGITLESAEDRMISPGIVKRPYVARFNLFVSNPVVPAQHAHTE